MDYLFSLTCQAVPFDELYHIPGSPAAKAVKSVCLGVNLQAGFLVFMERAIYKTPAVGLEVVMSQDGLDRKALFNFLDFHC